MRMTPNIENCTYTIIFYLYGRFLAPRVVPPCPPGWHEVADLVTCIKLVQQPMTWYDARDVCQGDGGDLVKVENSVMGDFILSKLS